MLLGHGIGAYLTQTTGGLFVSETATAWIGSRT